MDSRHQPIIPSDGTAETKPVINATVDSAKAERARILADRVDEAGRESFPASDPPSWSTLIPRTPDDR